MSKYNSLDTIETKDDVPTTITSFTTTINSSVYLDITILAHSDNFDTVVDRKMYVVKNINNNVSISDDIVTICNKQGHISISNVNTSLRVSETTIQVQVTGLQDTSIVWVCNLDAITNSLQI